MRHDLSGHYDVLGEIYEVIEKQDVVVDDEIVLGSCSGYEKIIEISTQQSDAEKLDTLIHELGHAIFVELGLDEDMSDEVVHVIVNAYAKVLVRNLVITPMSFNAAHRKCK